MYIPLLNLYLYSVFNTSYKNANMLFYSKPHNRTYAPNLNNSFSKSVSDIKVESFSLGKYCISV